MQVEDVVGGGSFARVYAVRRHATGETFAAKIVSKVVMTRMIADANDADDTDDSVLIADDEQASAIEDDSVDMLHNERQATCTEPTCPPNTTILCEL